MISKIENLKNQTRYYFSKNVIIYKMLPVTCVLSLETVLFLTYYQHSIKNTKMNPILSVKTTSDSKQKL